MDLQKAFDIVIKSIMVLEEMNLIDLSPTCLKEDNLFK